MAWICGFIARDNEKKKIDLSTTVIPDIQVNSISEWEFAQFTDDGVSYIKKDSDIDFIYYTGDFQSPSTQRTIKNFSGSAKYSYTSGVSENNTYTVLPMEESGFVSLMTSQVNNRDFMTRWRLVETKYIGLPVIDQFASSMNQLRNLKGQIIQVGSGDSKVFKKIGIEETSKSGLKTEIISEQREDDNYDFYDRVRDKAFSYSGFAAKHPVKMRATYTKYTFKVTLTDVNEGTYTCEIPTRDNRLLNKDGPFDIFCIPYTDDILI